MRPPIALTIAGSDPSGGAGIQADLKTFTALGVYGTACITALTAQNTQGVHGVYPSSAEAVSAQIQSVLDDVYVDATKLGMLANAEVSGAVADLLESRREDFGFLILDPVMVSTSGDQLLEPEAVQIIIERILPLADVVTPNLHEAAFMLGADLATDVEGMCEQARELLNLGSRIALVKGGHLRGSEVVDVYHDAQHFELLRGERFKTENTHGTGCTLSSAIAAQYARALQLNAQDAEQNGEPIAPVADLPVVASAREYLASAIEHGARWQISRHPETGHGPVNHLITLGA